MEEDEHAIDFGKGQTSTIERDIYFSDIPELQISVTSRRDRGYIQRSNPGVYDVADKRVPVQSDEISTKTVDRGMKVHFSRRCLIPAVLGLVIGAVIAGLVAFGINEIRRDKPGRLNHFHYYLIESNTFDKDFR